MKEHMLRKSCIGGKSMVGKLVLFAPHFNELGKIVGMKGNRFIVSKSDGEKIEVRCTQIKRWKE